MPKTRSVSKKKAKLTLAKFREHGNKRKKANSSCEVESELSSPPSKRSCNNSITVCPNSFYNIHDKSDGIDLSTFRLNYLKDYKAPKNIASSISNTLNSKFIYKDYTTASIVNVDDDNTKVPLPLVNKSRCLVEDFMKLPEKSEITVLIPKRKCEETSNSGKNKWSVECKKSFIQYGNEKSQRFYLFHGFIHSAPYFEKANINALSYSEINKALKRQKNNGYGSTCTLQQCLISDGFASKSHQQFQLLIKFADVLYGGRNGIQVWSHMNVTRDFSSNFRNSSDNSINDTLGFIADEIYLDKLATTSLLLKYYMVQSQKKQIQCDNYKIKKATKTKIEFDRVSYHYVNSIIEEKFYSAIESCYKEFCEITQPLLSRDVIDELVSLYKSHLKQNYELQMEMFGFLQKKELARNKHLKDAGYYDRLVFYHYLAQERVRFNHMLASWGMVTAGAGYARGECNTQNQTFFGNSTTTSTFMKRTKYWRESMEESIHLRLKNENSIVACINNNQKGFSLKYQRCGTANNYIKVTGCVIKSFFYCNEIPQTMPNSTSITYCNQIIPSPLNMSKYEVVGNDNESILNIFIDHVKEINDSNDESCYISDGIDFSGTRVSSYHNLCKIFNTVNLIRIVMAGIYHRGNNIYSYVEFTPSTWKSHSIQVIAKRMNRLKGSLLFKCYNEFQRNSVRKWNPYYDKVCSLIVPKVMLHDEISTDGYGKCVIELLTLHGILEKCNAGDRNFE